MTFSKFLFFSLSALCFVLTGCSTESRKKSKEAPGAQTDFKTCSADTNFRVKSGGFMIKATSKIVHSDNGIPKQKTFNFQACLLERIGGGKITADIPFSIENLNGKVITKKISDSEGCLGWQETLSYNHIEPETYIKLTRQIRAQSDYTGCVKAEAAFLPWADGPAALTDLRGFDYDTYEPDTENLSNGKIKILGQAAQQIDIAVDALNFEFKGMDYSNFSLDRLLNLTVAHFYTLRIKPSVIRKTIANPAVPFALTGGKLKAYLAIFTDEANPTLITVAEFDLKYEKTIGQYMADVSLKFQNVSEMTSRTQAYLTLVPSEELEGLKEMNFKGLLKPAPLTALSLSPGNVSAYNLFKNQTKTPLSLKPLDTLKSKQSGMTEMTLDNPPTSAFTSWFRSYDFKALVNEVLYENLGEMTGYKEKFFTSVLCQKLYPKTNNDMTSFGCQNNPSGYMKMATRFLVEEITSKPAPLHDTTVEELEMKISYTATKSSTYSEGWKLALGAGIAGAAGFDLFSTPKESPLKGALSLKGSGGLDYNWVWEGKYAQGESVGITSSSAMKITSEGTSFSFKANVRPCLIVVPTAAQTSRLAKQNIVNHGVYFCGDKVIENQERTETWYLLTQSLGVKDSVLTDPLSKKAGPWRMMVRGKVPMLMFYHFLKESGTKLVLEKMPADNLKSKFDASIMQMQEFPGLLPLK